jgi:hypothetical protein
MPCNTITSQTLSVGLQKAIPALLLKAIEEVVGDKAREANGTLRVRTLKGNEITWSSASGLTITGRDQRQIEVVGKDIRMAYSKQAVSWAAQRAGWKVASTGDNTIRVTR